MIAFPKINGRIYFNEPLFMHTTFRIGGPCGAWVEVDDEISLRRILAFAKAKRKKIFIIGGGSNILAGDKGFNGIVIHLAGGCFKRIEFFGKKIKLGAGVMLGRAVNLTCKKGLEGIEGLVGIPGTVGGAIFMNSGYRQNISDFLEEVRVMDKENGNIKVIKRGNLCFGYRHSNLERYIILDAALRLKKNNKKKLSERKNELLRVKKDEQPLGRFSAGCIFKNPNGKISAARYIDMLRLKGKRMGRAKISEKHANFIINLQNAKAADVLGLIDFVRKRVKSHFGVNLVTEIVEVGLP